MKSRLPRARRSEIFPILEGRAVLSSPPVVERALKAKVISEQDVIDRAVAEFEMVAYDPNKIEVKINPKLAQAEEKYRELVANYRAALVALKSSANAIRDEKETGIRGLFKLGAMMNDNDGISQEKMLAEQQEYIEVLHGTLIEMKKAFQTLVTKSGAIPKDLPVEKQNQLALTRETMFSLYRRSDAFKKFREFKRVQAELSAQKTKADFYEEALRIRQRAEELQIKLHQSTRKTQFPDSISEIILRDLRFELDRFADQAIDTGLVKLTTSESESEQREKLARGLCRSILNNNSESLRERLRSMNHVINVEQADWRAELASSENIELAELIAERDALDLLRQYHIERRRFLRVGCIAEEFDAIRKIIVSPRGPILRSLLYGPPGTGKTEMLREIGATFGSRRVKVISVHESSRFESLIGTNMIPLPKANSLGDGERYYRELKAMSREQAVKEIPQEIIGEFDGQTAIERAGAYLDWYGMKLKMARAISALGAVSEDDPRVQKIMQKTLAAWLDQPLVEGLIAGDLIILDEVDRARNAMEGLNDLFTRRPGSDYQPAGRPEAFRIHPDARIVMTSNWGDPQTMESAGGGQLAAPIVDRLADIRKVGYLDPATERTLFEIMTSRPDGSSMLRASEAAAARILLENIVPQLRSIYLKPEKGKGKLHLTSPFSVRKLENIARRLIDETTQLRVRNEEGRWVHLIEATWQVVAAGPFPEEEKEQQLLALAMLLAKDGFWGVIPDDISVSRLAVVSEITGISADKLKGFIGTSGGSAIVMKNPHDFLGTRLESEANAKNEMLFKPLVFSSPRLEREATRKRFNKEIEDQGGNPEAQRALEEIANTWEGWHEARRKLKTAEDAEQLFDAETKMLFKMFEEYFSEESRQLRAEDLQIFINRIAEGVSNDNVLHQRSGLLVSFVINRWARDLPKTEPLMTEIALKSLDQLDYLGYRLPANIVLRLNGQMLGDFVGREMRGGTIIADIVGDNAGYKMQSGEFSTYKAGQRAAHRMTGGKLTIMQDAGSHFGKNMKGGEAKAATIGTHGGHSAEGGRIIVGSAGKYFGESSGKKVVLEAQSADGLGRHIEATVIIGGKKIIDRGKKITEEVMSVTP